MKLAAFIAQKALIVGLVGGLALAIGWLSRFFYVVLLPGIAIGLLAGALVGFLGLISTTWNSLVRRLSLGVLVLWGCVIGIVMDDFHHQDSFREQVALAVYADSGADGAPLSEEELDFFARGSEAIMKTNMETSVGFSGPAARWLHRLDGGIRTFGSWERRRVIPVGRAFSLLFIVFELGVSYWFGARVLARIRVNRTQDPTKTMSEGDVPNLQDEGDENQGAAQ